VKCGSVAAGARRDRAPAAPIGPLRAAPQLYVYVLYLAMLCATSCSLTDQLSRVAVPGTDLYVVLSRDEKFLWRCELFAGRKSVSEQLICGAPNYGEGPVTVTTQQQGTFFYIHWVRGDSGTTVKVDTRSRTIEQVPETGGG